MAYAAGARDISSPALATPEQVHAETLLLRLLDDPATTAAWKANEDRLSGVELARSADGSARLPHAVRAWTAGLAMRWLSADPAKPAILLSTDNTPRHWCGRDIPAMGAAGDNPDHVYRSAFIDGGGRYVIRGKIDLAHRPVQLGIEVVRGLPGKLAVSAASSGTKVKNQIDLITDDHIACDADGGFEVYLDRDETSGPNHLSTADEPLTLIIRDVLADWREKPAWLEIERLDPPGIAPFTYEEVRERVLSDLPGYLDFWTGFPLRWMGGVKPNGFAAPVARDGGWGYQAGVRFSHAPGQLTLVRMSKGLARYLGAQVCDPWFLSLDARRHVTSLNHAQAVSADGDSFTLVLSAEDPGVVNWLDTGGLHDGMSVLRWQAVPPGERVEDMLLDVRVMDRATLDSGYPDLPRLSAAGRRDQRARHAAEYALRFE